MVLNRELFEEQDQSSLFLAVSGTRVLALLAVVLALFMVLTIVLLLSRGDSPLMGATIPALLLALTVLLLLWWGRAATALRLFIWGALLLAIYSGFSVAGLQTPALMFLPVLTMAGSLAARDPPGGDTDGGGGGGDNSHRPVADQSAVAAANTAALGGGADGPPLCRLDQRHSRGRLDFQLSSAVPAHAGAVADYDR